jgi:hypothetical protein
MSAGDDRLVATALCLAGCEEGVAPPTRRKLRNQMLRVRGDAQQDVLETQMEKPQKRPERYTVPPQCASTPRESVARQTHPDRPP